MIKSLVDLCIDVVHKERIKFSECPKEVKNMIRMKIKYPVSYIGRGSEDDLFYLICSKFNETLKIFGDMCCEYRCQNENCQTVKCLESNLPTEKKSEVFVMSSKIFYLLNALKDRKYMLVRDEECYWDILGKIEFLIENCHNDEFRFFFKKYLEIIMN